MSGLLVLSSEIQTAANGETKQTRPNVDRVSFEQLRQNYKLSTPAKERVTIHRVFGLASSDFAQKCADEWKSTQKLKAPKPSRLPKEDNEEVPEQKKPRAVRPKAKDLPPTNPRLRKQKLN